MRYCLLAMMAVLVLSHCDSVQAAEPAPEFRIAGYLPDYRLADFDPAAAAHLTDLILFSAQPTATGGIDLGRLKQAPLEKFKALKTQHRLRLILAVGGWDRSDKFAAVATSPKLREEFARNAVRFCLQERFDGLDLDWEHPHNAAEEQGYADLLQTLSAAFKPHGLRLSVTLAGWQRIPPAGFAAADWVQVMAYDHKGPHSTLENALADARQVLDQKVSPEKLILGLPFYGRDQKNPDRALTYREITAQHTLAPSVDEVGDVYFNGPQTIERKIAAARELGFGGVMVWELGQDAPGEKSLLRLIHSAARKPNTAAMP